MPERTRLCVFDGEFARLRVERAAVTPEVENVEGVKEGWEEVKD